MLLYRIPLTILSSFTFAIKLGIYVVRGLSNKGSQYTLTVGYRALPMLFHISDHMKLNRLIFTNPHLVTLTNRQPRLVYKYLGSYLSKSFSRKERLTFLLYHYSYLNSYASDDFFKRVIEKSSIWQQCIIDDLFAISLEFPFGIDFEGDLSLVFKLNHKPIYAISFTFIPASIENGSTNKAIFVSRVQGSKRFDLIKKSTKLLYDTTPAALLLVALQGIALSFGVKLIIGVSTEAQLCRSYEDAEPNFFDYNFFWASFNAEKKDADSFHLSIPFPEKPLTSLKANHRTRTIRKRQYKRQVCQSVRLHSEQNFLR